MAKELYACTNCKKTFTRKFNAERHNNQVHNGIAVIFNKETDWISDKRNTIAFSPDMSAKPEIKKPSSNLESDKESTTNTILDHNHNNFKELFKKRLELESEYTKENEKEQIVLKIIGKLTPYIDTFDSLPLSSGIGLQERNQFLAELIISSLSTSDPFAFIKEQIEFCQSLLTMGRAITLTSQYYKIQRVEANEILKTLVLNSPYTKKNFKLKR